MPALTGILETALYAQDLDEAEAFYKDVLGLPVYARLSRRHVFFRCGTQMLLIFNPEAVRRPPPPGAALPVPPHGSSGPGHVCFSAPGEDLDRWRAQLAAKGVAVEADFVWPGGGRSLYFRDPAGNSIEIAEPRIWGLFRPVPDPVRPPRAGPAP